MSKTLASPFIGVAVAGLALSLFVHVTGLLGIPTPLNRIAWILHPGLFVVWIPAALAQHSLAPGAWSWESLRLTLRGCPRWMRYATWGFAGYAPVSFVWFLFISPKGGLKHMVSLREFSGHWMACYAAAAATLYSYVHVDTSVRRCVNGHAIGPSAAFCSVCGHPLQQDSRFRKSIER